MRDAPLEDVVVKYGHRIADADKTTVRGAIASMRVAMPVVSFDETHVARLGNGLRIAYGVLDGRTFVEAPWGTKADLGYVPKTQTMPSTGSHAGDVHAVVTDLSPTEVETGAGTSFRIHGPWTRTSSRAPRHPIPVDARWRARLTRAHLSSAVRCDGRTFVPTWGAHVATYDPAYCDGVRFDAKQSVIPGFGYRTPEGRAFNRTTVEEAALAHRPGREPTTFVVPDAVRMDRTTLDLLLAVERVRTMGMDTFGKALWDPEVESEALLRLPAVLRDLRLAAAAVDRPALVRTLGLYVDAVERVTMDLAGTERWADSAAVPPAVAEARRKNYVRPLTATLETVRAAQAAAARALPTLPAPDDAFDAFDAVVPSF